MSYTPDWGPLQMARPSHDGFVFKAWLKTLRREPPFERMRHGQYQRGQKRVIEGLLARPGVHCYLAVNAEQGEPFYGFICYEWTDDQQFRLHFVYVRKPYRQRGIATAMLAFAGHDVSTSLTATATTKALTYQNERWQIDYDFFSAWEAIDATS